MTGVQTCALPISYHSQPDLRVNLLWRGLSYFDDRLGQGDADGGADIADLVQELTDFMRDIDRDILPTDPVSALQLATELCGLDREILDFAHSYGDCVYEVLRQSIALWWKAAVALRAAGARPHLRWAIVLERFVHRFSPVPFFAIAPMLLKDQEIREIGRAHV